MRVRPGQTATIHAPAFQGAPNFGAIVRVDRLDDEGSLRGGRVFWHCTTLSRFREPCCPYHYIFGREPGYRLSLADDALTPLPTRAEVIAYDNGAK